MHYTRPCMRKSWSVWLAAALSACLLELPFPVAGPMPPWRSVFAWIGLVPLLWAILCVDPARRDPSSPPRLPACLFCGVLWYMGNCYWIYDTMLITAACRRRFRSLHLLLFSLVLGLYFGLFGLGLALVTHHRIGAPRSRLRAFPLGCARPRRRAHHQRTLGSAWLLAGGQRIRQPARSLDRRLRNQLCSRRRECAPCRRNADPKYVRDRGTRASIFGPRVLGRRRTDSVRDGRVWHLCVCRLNLRPPPPPSSSSPTSMSKTPATGSARPNGTSTWRDFSGSPASKCKSYIAGIPQTGAPDRRNRLRQTAPSRSDRLA